MSQTVYVACITDYAKGECESFTKVFDSMDKARDYLRSRFNKIINALQHPQHCYSIKANANEIKTYDNIDYFSPNYVVIVAKEDYRQSGVIHEQTIE